MLLVITVLFTAGYIPAEASYWEGMKEIYEWDAIEGKSEIDLNISMNNLNQQYKVKMYSLSNLEDFSSYMDIQVEDMVGDINIPNIKMYTHGTDIYINTEAVKTLISNMGINEPVEIDEEFIMLKNNEGTVQINTNILKDMIKFIEEMELGIELGMTQNGNTYTLELNSDKIVDLLDAYLSYVMNNVDKLPAGMMPEELTISEEEKQQAIDTYNNMIAPQIQMLKGFITGSYYKQVTTFDKDLLNEESELYITIPEVEDMNILVKMLSTSKKIDAADIKLPASVKIITEKELNELIMKSMANPHTDGKELKVAMDLEGSYFKFDNDNVEEGKIELTVKDGKSYISTKDAESIFGVTIPSDNGSIWIRELENYGYQINWVGEVNMIEVYKLK